MGVLVVEAVRFEAAFSPTLEAETAIMKSAATTKRILIVAKEFKRV